MKLTPKAAQRAIRQLKKLDDQIKLDWIVGHDVGCRLYAVTQNGDILTKRVTSEWVYENAETLAGSPKAGWTWDQRMSAEDFGENVLEIRNMLPEAEFFEDGTLNWAEFVQDISWDLLCEWADEDKSPLQTMIEEVEAMVENKQTKEIEEMEKTKKKMIVPQCVQYDIELPGINETATVILSRNGQQLPQEGDQVCVLAKLCLPLEEGMKNITKELQFGSRCSLLREKLDRDWGYFEEGAPWRYRQWRITGETWAEALRKAKKEANEELSKLIEVLQVRQQKLADAE